MPKVGVVGTTSWGTTLGILIAQQGAEVSLWSRTEAEAAILEADRENARFLPGIRFPSSLSVSASSSEALNDADLVLIVVPSRTFRSNIRRVCGALRSDAIVVSATKGLETSTGKRMSEILADEMPPATHDGICALSGPNLSREILAGKPASTVIASTNVDAARTAQLIINSSRFRVRLHQKDLHNALLTGKELGVPLPVTSLVQQMIGSLMNDGKGDADHSAIANFLEDMANVKISGG